MINLELMGGRKVLGFAVVCIDEYGNRFLVYSDDVKYGEITFKQEVNSLEGDDRIIATATRIAQYDVNLIGSTITIVKENRNISDLLLIGDNKLLVESPEEVDYSKYTYDE